MEISSAQEADGMGSIFPPFCSKISALPSEVGPWIGRNGKELVWWITETPELMGPSEWRVLLGGDTLASAETEKVQRGK